MGVGQVACLSRPRSVGNISSTKSMSGETAKCHVMLDKIARLFKLLRVIIGNGMHCFHAPSHSTDT